MCMCVLFLNLFLSRYFNIFQKSNNTRQKKVLYVRIISLSYVKCLLSFSLNVFGDGVMLLISLSWTLSFIC